MRRHTKQQRNERQVYRTTKQTIILSPQSLPFNDRNSVNRESVNPTNCASFQSLPSVMSTSSLSSVTSTHSNYSNYSSPPMINNNQLKKNQSLSALHHKYPTKYNNKGLFIDTTTFSAPISPNESCKLPPIHKYLKQTPLHINSDLVYQDTNNKKKFRCHTTRKHRKNMKRNQSSPAGLHLDLSKLSIDENSNKTNYKIIPKSAHCSNTKLRLNASGIKSNFLLQFDLSPKSANYEITKTGAFKQNGFIISSDGLFIESSKNNFNVKSSDFVEVSILGRGSSSVVYKTWDLKHRRFLALKCISVFEQDKRKQIENELKLLTNNDCEYIVDFYGSYFYCGQIIFCLEYFDIGSLQDLIEINGSIPLHIISYIIKYIINAVDYLHSKKNIIYRDIKPSNVLIHSDGRIKLSDFGIYHQCKDNSLNAVCDEVIGTTIYKSPQRLCGKKYSYLSDIWSIGLCVAQSLYPHFPLFIENDESTMLIQKYILKATKPIHDFFPEKILLEISNDPIIDFMDKCLVKRESLRLNAKQLLQHEFIKQYNYNETIHINDFKSYLLNSNISKLKKDKYKIELVSIKQSLKELFTNNKIKKNDMQIPIQQIQKIID